MKDYNLKDTYQRDIQYLSKKVKRITINRINKAQTNSIKIVEILKDKSY